MRVFCALVLMLCGAVMWSGVLQASKYTLITNKARSGVALRVAIESQALDAIPANLRNYYKKLLIDQLATYENPLAAHIDLTRYWLVANAINDDDIAARRASTPVDAQQRQEYEKELEEWVKNNPSLSGKWEERHNDKKLLYSEALAVSAEITMALQQDEQFWKTFATEELQRGVDFENFLAEQRQALGIQRDVSIHINSIFQKLSAAFQKLAAINAKKVELALESIAFLNNLPGNAERMEYAFKRAVSNSLVSKLLDGTDSKWPSLTDSGDITLQEEQEVARIIKDVWHAVYEINLIDATYLEGITLD